MKKSLLFLIFSYSLFYSLSAFSQEEIKSIKVKRESYFVKAAFDEGDYTVIALDKYGNPHTEAIKSFTIIYKDGKTSYEAKVEGNTFPKKTIEFLTKKRKEATKICLGNLKAEDAEGHIEDLPPLCDIVIFPDCKKTHKK